MNLRAAHCDCCIHFVHRQANMMDAEDNDTEELGAIPSHMFENAPSSVSSLGGWATGAGSALFAVTKVCYSHFIRTILRVFL